MEDDGRYRVLVCEDDGLLRTTLDRGLRRAGYLVDAVATGGAAVTRARESPPDAVVLDIGLPDADGRDVCQALRAQGCVAGVVFLTARHHTDDVLSGFAVGGDDYLRKPFNFAELLARVAGVLRRRPVAGTDFAGSAPSAREDPSLPGDGGERRLWVDPAAHTVRYGAGQVALTPTEFRFLACLIGRRPDVVRRSELIAAAWPGTAHVSDNAVDQYVARTRRKLRELGIPVLLESVRGVGYRLRES